jgi:hypothetical protein
MTVAWADAPVVVAATPAKANVQMTVAMRLEILMELPPWRIRALNGSNHICVSGAGTSGRQSATYLWLPDQSTYYLTLCHLFH